MKNLCIVNVENEQYLYLYVGVNQNSEYDFLFTIDKENGGINNSLIEGVDINVKIENKKNILHSDDFLLGAYYKNKSSPINMNSDRELIICTASIKHKENSIMVFNEPIYRVDTITLYNVKLGKIQSKISRPDLYFSPKLNLISLSTDNSSKINIKTYESVLDNSNLFCWNKELIRPFSKYIKEGENKIPCMIVLQGFVECLLDNNPKITFMSKFKQTNLFNLNFNQKCDNFDELECHCQLIFSAVDDFQQTSHEFKIVKSKHPSQNTSNSIYFNIDEEPFSSDLSIIDKFKVFEKLYNQNITFLFSQIHSGKVKQEIKFIIISQDICRLAYSSLFYMYCYTFKFQDQIQSNRCLFKDFSNPEIKIKSNIQEFYKKCINMTAFLMNEAQPINWEYENNKCDGFNFNNNKKQDDYFIFKKPTKSEKFILDPKHVTISYHDYNKEHITIRAHFQEEFVVSEIRIKIHHRDPAQVVKMRISLENDVHSRHFFCPEILLPNPDSGKEEELVFKLSKVAKCSLLYPVDFSCFEKVKFVTLYFTTALESNFTSLNTMFPPSYIKFVVKRLINKQQHYEIKSALSDVDFCPIGNCKTASETELKYIEGIDVALSCPQKAIIEKMCHMEVDRIHNRIPDYVRTLIFIKKRISPTEYDFRSCAIRCANQQTCPFCGASLIKDENAQFFEICQNCPLLISKVKNKTNFSFPVCGKCSQIYQNNNPLLLLSGIEMPPNRPVDGNKIIRAYLTKNKDKLVNISENKEYGFTPADYISAYSYPAEFNRSDVETVFNSKSSKTKGLAIKTKRQVEFVVYFQSRMNIQHSPTYNNKKLEIKCGVGVCVCMKLTFFNKFESEELFLSNVKIEKQIVPNVINEDRIHSSSRKYQFICKSYNPDKNHPNVFSIEHNENVRGYRVQFNYQQMITSIVIAYYNKEELVGFHSFMFPAVAYSKKTFDFPALFELPHDLIKVFFLDRQIIKNPPTISFISEVKYL